jgi:hypothetical protein
MNALRTIAARALCASVALSPMAFAEAPPDSTRSLALGVSPLLVDAAAEVWGVIARPENPIWPGWNASDTPLLLYLPGRQDLLIGHPHPPEGFDPYTGPLRFPDAVMMVKDGPTLIADDGQNTARDIGGTRTLVVADPLSNLRQDVASMIADPRPAAEKIRTLELEDLAADAYDQLALIVHEAFHVHQDRVAPDRGSNEMLLLYYPVLSAENNAAFGLEGVALERAVAARDVADCRAEALRWLAVREYRRALLPARAIQYEDGVEFTEGTAEYTEYRLFEVLEGRKPSPGLERAQGFSGFGDLSPQRRALLARMRRHLDGDVNVNNAPYGTAPLRKRLYYSGMAIGLLLDRLAPDWKHDLATTDSSLTALARRAIHASPAELASAWEAERADTAYTRRLTAKTRLAQEGARNAAARLAAILSGPGTGILVDYSKLASNKVGLAFTPFGITVVDSARTIFDQVPISARFADESSLNQSASLPLLRDTHHRMVLCRLERVVRRTEIARLAGDRRLGSATPAAVKLELPGLTLDLKRATLEWGSGTLVAVLQPGPAPGSAPAGR